MTDSRNTVAFLLEVLAASRNTGTTAAPTPTQPHPRCPEPDDDGNPRGLVLHTTRSGDSVTRETSRCGHCNAAYTPTRSDSTYCTSRCRQAAHRTRRKATP
jgi:hypothetical protein